MKRIGKRMKPGFAYRRAELAKFASSASTLDRDLCQLVESGRVRKYCRGIYFRPRTCSLGELPPYDHSLLKALLAGDDFLIASLNVYNSLSVGTTQLYNEAIVYNRRISGWRNIYGLNYRFLKDRPFPKKHTLEFLYVDLINNLDLLAEDSNAVRRSAAERVREIGIEKVFGMSEKYGKSETRKFFDQLRQSEGSVHVSVDALPA